MVIARSNRSMMSPFVRFILFLCLLLCLVAVCGILAPESSKHVAVALICGYYVGYPLSLGGEAKTILYAVIDFFLFVALTST